MVNCNPKYKNLNRVQSFSEQRYATVQLMQQVCMNDEYLKQEVDELTYLTPPAVRKRFNPIPVDENISFGYFETTDNNVIFDSSTLKTVNIDFTDESLIDTEMSTAVIESFVDNGSIIKQAVIPYQEGEVDKSVKNFNQGELINSYWYVGYDKNETYQIRPNWLKNWKLVEIPAVSRAQTFKVPSGKGGKLEAVSLQIQNNGTTWGSWGSPLIVQIWKTKQVRVPKTNWNNKTRKATPTGEYEWIAWPDGNPYIPLAETQYDPSKTDPGFISLVFDNPCTLEAGESYAIVIHSPLSEWSHCPRIGGWGRNCSTHKYENGDAFFSNKNGRNWERYGRNDDKVSYKFGKNTPRDFAFQLNIRQDQNAISTGDHYLYLKPIHTNPIKKVVFSCDDSGDAASFAGKLLYQVSTDGREWHDVTNHEYNFSPNSEEEYPRVLFVRVKMWTTDSGVTPVVQSMNLYLTTALPKKMYVRTHIYYPKVSPMLGASHWGRLFAPVEMDPTTDCKVEIVQDKTVTEHFNVITAEELPDYDYIEGLDIEKITDESLAVRYNYLIDTPSAIELLRQNGIYVKPWEDENEVEHGLSFWTLNEDEEKVYSPFKLKRSPAYPMVECQNQPLGDEGVCSFGEWYDYTVDYENDTIFLAEDVIEDLPVGSITFSYNPVFIQDLTQKEVGRTYNASTAQYVENPLVIDYFKQEFIVDENIIETREVPLRVSAVDPLRSVILNKGTDEEKELIEDVDFEVDYTKGILRFKIPDDNVVSLNLNDELEIVYTPNLEDVGISLGYTCTRGENTDKQVRILPNWIEYKV